MLLNIDVWHLSEGAHEYNCIMSPYFKEELLCMVKTKSIATVPACEYGDNNFILLL